MRFFTFVHVFNSMRTKEEIAQYKKEYYEKNKKKIAEQWKVRYEQNKEKLKAYQAEYRKCWIYILFL